MRADLDDLVIALYVTIDELVEPRRGPGRRPKLTDAELVCLAVAQVLLGYHSERRWLRAVAGRHGHLFPYICTLQPAAAPRRAAGGHDPARPGGHPPVVVRPVAAAGRHPGPLRRLAGDRPPLRAGRLGRLRL
jgi:hypothetical protein